MAKAVAEATVVEEEDIELSVMEQMGCRDGVRQGTFAAVEEQRGGARGCICGNPPAIELGLAGCVDAEVDFGGRKPGGSRCLGYGAAGLQDQLPLAAIEEGTDGDVRAEDGHEKHSGESGENPARVNDFMHVF